MSNQHHLRISQSTPLAVDDSAVKLDLSHIKPQWFHPLLAAKNKGITHISKQELQSFAYDYYLRFLPYFKHQPEGSINPGVHIAFTKRMRQKLGLAYLFEHKIKLNETYFAKDPSLLPYTLFHEMTHIWLYDCLLDPGHTRRFYTKMQEFETTGLPIDKGVHIHRRVAPEGKYVYYCPNCENRWYLKKKLRYAIYCGHCYDKAGQEFFAKPLTKSPAPTSPSSPVSSLGNTRNSVA